MTPRKRGSGHTKRDHSYNASHTQTYHLFCPSMSKQHAHPAACPVSPPAQFDDEAHAESRPSHVPPDGGYGWVYVAACFKINGFTWELYP
jgi:hypothetical protein